MIPTVPARGFPLAIIPEVDCIFECDNDSCAEGQESNDDEGVDDLEDFDGLDESESQSRSFVASVLSPHSLASSKLILDSVDTRILKRAALRPLQMPTLAPPIVTAMLTPNVGTLPTAPVAQRMNMSQRRAMHLLAAAVSIFLLIVHEFVCKCLRTLQNRVCLQQNPMSRSLLV